MIKTRVRLLIGSFASAILLAMGSLGFAAASNVGPDCPPMSHPQGNNCKVTICHRTDSVTNPYVSPDVDISAANGNTLGDHYSVHTGPVATSQQVAQSLKDNGQKWGDIIPPVEGVEPGQNWTPEGIAIYNNGCNYVTPGQGGGETPPLHLPQRLHLQQPSVAQLWRVVVKELAHLLQSSYPALVASMPAVAAELKPTQLQLSASAHRC
jgi:hypothetical protein